MSAIICGGTPITVTDQTGQQHDLLVRLIKIKEFPEYFRLADDEEGLAAFAISRDLEFTQTLTVESILAICEQVHDSNFQNACRWATRRANFSEAMLPVAKKGIRMQQTLGNYAPNAPSFSAKP